MELWPPLLIAQVEKTELMGETFLWTPRRTTRTVRPDGSVVTMFLHLFKCFGLQTAPHRCIDELLCGIRTVTWGWSRSHSWPRWNGGERNACLCTSFFIFYLIDTYFHTVVIRLETTVLIKNFYVSNISWLPRFVISLINDFLKENIEADLFKGYLALYLNMILSVTVEQTISWIKA